MTRAERIPSRNAGRRWRIMVWAENYRHVSTRYWNAHPELARMDYAPAQRRMFDEFFYQSDSQAAALRELGQEAVTVIPHCIPLQAQWARENKLWLPPYFWRRWPALDYLLLRTRGLAFRGIWHRRVLTAQLRAFQPDVVVVFSGIPPVSALLRRFFRQPPLWIGHGSCVLSESHPYQDYDLILTTAANIREEFLRRGCQCRLVQHAFDERIWRHLESAPPDREVIFFGSVSPHHRRRTAHLEGIAALYSLDIYGEGYEDLPETSPLRKCRWGGNVFGLDMYRRMARYRISLHVPADFGMADAGAQRLFEIPGAGVLLLSWAQPGLERYFEIGREMDVFSSAAEAVANIRGYLQNEPWRAAVAEAGERRVQHDHHYRNRMREWLDIFQDLQREKTSPLGKFSAGFPEDDPRSLPPRGGKSP